MTAADSYSAIMNSNADEAYERILPEAMALEADELLPINIDVSSALVTAMGIVAKMPQLEDDMRELPAFPAEMIAKFPDYVLALLSAQSRYAFAISPPKQDPAVLDEGVRWRDILIADVEALIARKLLDSACLRELTRASGYKNVAFDLAGLTRVMKTAWPTIEGQTALKATELAEVDKLSLRLMTVVARREQSPEAIAEATTIRQRMFTLFHKAYDAHRRGAIYLRWDQDDVDEFVPSIFAGRGNGKAGRRSDTETSSQAGGGESDEMAPTEVRPPASEQTAAVPAAGGTPGNGSSTAVPAGMPGASPYTAS